VGGVTAVLPDRDLPAIVDTPNLAPHRPCTECNELIGRHYGSRPVMCAGQPFGSAACAKAWREAPRPTFDVSAVQSLLAKRCDCGVLANEVCDCAEFLAGSGTAPTIVMGVGQSGRRGGAR
jgi:hypothetical protein